MSLLKNVKILIYDLPNLPTSELNDFMIHCSNISHFVSQGQKYQNSILIIVCASNKLSHLVPELSTINFDYLYILNIGENINDIIQNLLLKTTFVFSDKELMRHLCTKTALCYHSEGTKHKQNGNNVIANICFLDSMRTMECATMFI
ncbi:unnamed protein product [Adineta steineri]|uniref:Uncharacterized protein n=1 Tax=Adineta steineri TaxID=433720 RepID=A0A815EQ32_9BILA|nr:unnamed protein product [Adineta steineri]CAF1318327.1 unnamed protein product [Adineta steineri]